MTYQQTTCETGCARYTRFVALVAEFHQSVQPGLEKLRLLPAPEIFDSIDDLFALESELSDIAAELRRVESAFAPRFDSGVMQYGPGVGAGVGLFGAILNLSLSSQVEAMRQTAQVRRQRLQEGAR